MIHFDRDCTVGFSKNHGLPRLLADTCRHLGDFLDRMHPIKPGHQAIMQRCGDRDGVERAIQNQPVVALFIVRRIRGSS